MANHVYWEYENYSSGDKAKQQELGAFYTPKELVDRMLANVTAYTGKTFYDPTFGYMSLIGSILDRKLDEGESINNAITEVYGCELDPDVYKKGLEKLEVYARKNNASESAISVMKTHFKNADTLKFDPDKYNADPNLNGWDSNGNLWTKFSWENRNKPKKPCLFGGTVSLSDIKNIKRK